MDQEIAIAFQLKELQQTIDFSGETEGTSLKTWSTALPKQPKVWNWIKPRASPRNIFITTVSSKRITGVVVHDRLPIGLQFFRE
jgi:hypothetical protein